MNHIRPKAITEYVIDMFATLIRSYDPNIDRGKDFEVEYNLDTRCYVIRHTNNIILRDSFFTAFRAVLANNGISVHYIFIKVDAI